MPILSFPIPDDDEMLAAAEPMEAYLTELGFSFRPTGRATSIGGNVCMFELEFDDAEAGDSALCVWTARRCISGECESSR